MSAGRCFGNDSPAGDSWPNSLDLAPNLQRGSGGNIHDLGGIVDDLAIDSYCALLDHPTGIGDGRCKSYASQQFVNSEPVFRGLDCGLFHILRDLILLKLPRPILDRSRRGIGGMEVRYDSAG